jgi:phosphopantothenoylcysteine decarboxylase/phosphopantothenate--cysteine ligase
MMDHIELSRWADLMVLCPATANTLAHLAAGLADDVVGSIFLAAPREKPYLIFPAMNHQMFAHPATQRTIETLKKWGVQVMPTGLGPQACGEIGEGRLLEPTEILDILEAQFTSRESRKILVTGGATREFIDGVRFITNVSTGRTAARLTEEFLKAGHHVTLAAGTGAEIPQSRASGTFRLLRFSDFKSLYTLLKTELQTANFYDLIVHCAAVSDYSVAADQAFVPKLSSDFETLNIALKRNPKIVNEMKTWSPASRLVSFKLTNEATPEEIQTAVAKLLEGSRSDLVIQNDLSEMQGEDRRRFRLFKSPVEPALEAQGLPKLAQSILERSF